MRAGCFFIFLCLFTSTPAFSAEIVEELQKTYANIQSIDADFSQLQKHINTNSEESRTGKFYFKKPLYVKWEALGAEPELLIVNKDNVWNVFPNDEIIYKYDLSVVQNAYNIFSLISGTTKLNEHFYVDNMGLDMKTIKLHLIPKEPVQSLVEAFFWINPKTKLIEKFELIDFYGNKNEVRFTNYKLNTINSDAMFLYTPDASLLLEDRSQQ